MRIALPCLILLTAVVTACAPGGGVRNPFTGVTGAGFSVPSSLARFRCKAA